MRYVILAADYGDVSLRDEETSSMTGSELCLPSDLIAEITAWNERYRPVIPAAIDQ